MDLRFFLSNFAFLSFPVVLDLRSLVNIPFLKPKVFKTDQCYDLLWHRGRSDFSFLYSMLWLYSVLWCFSSWKWNCSTSRETAACQYFCSLSLSSSPDLDQSRVIFFVCVCSAVCFCEVLWSWALVMWLLCTSSLQNWRWRNAKNAGDPGYPLSQSRGLN